MSRSGRILLGADQRAAGGREERHGAGGGGAGLHHGVGDVLGLLERAADEDAGPRRVQRPQFGGLGEAPLVQVDADAVRLATQRRARFEPERQDDHVELFFDLLEVRAEVRQREVLRVGHLERARDERAHVADALLVLGPFVVAVEILAERAQIQEENRDVQIRVRVPWREWLPWLRPCSTRTSSSRCRSRCRATRRTG